MALPKLLYFLPTVKPYILPLIEGMSHTCQIDVIFSPNPPTTGVGHLELPQSQHIQWIEKRTIDLFRWANFGKYQLGSLSHLLRSRPDAILIYANMNYINFWLVLVLGRIIGIPVYSRGHGLVKKKSPSLLYRLLLFLVIHLSTKYICYTPKVFDSVLRLALSEKKLAVDDNFQYNQFPVSPHQKTGSETGILFIGRLRDKCGIEQLIDIVRGLHLQHPEITLHIIGGGQLEDLVRSIAVNEPWIVYYGTLYDDEQIAAITKKCRVGCVVGSAGLSVVHLMSFSLPTITHGDLFAHQGPEPGYITDGENGWFYGHMFDLAALENQLLKVFSLPQEEMKKVQTRAWETYRALSDPPFHQRILKIMGLMTL